MKVSEYFKLFRRLKDFKIVEWYEVLDRLNDRYIVRIVYNDGEEEIHDGDLEYYNAKFEIIQERIWS